MECKDCTPGKLCRWHERRAEAKRPKPLKQTALKRSKVPLQRSRKPIKPRAEKRAKEMRQYVPEMLKFLEDNPICQCGMIDPDTGEVCQRASDQLQHAQGRENHLLLYKAHWRAINWRCHQKEISKPLEAQATGITIRRNVAISERVKKQ